MHMGRILYVRRFPSAWIYIHSFVSHTFFYFCLFVFWVVLLDAYQHFGCLNLMSDIFDNKQMNWKLKTQWPNLCNQWFPSFVVQKAQAHRSCRADVCMVFCHTFTYGPREQHTDTLCSVLKDTVHVFNRCFSTQFIYQPFVKCMSFKKKPCCRGCFCHALHSCNIVSKEFEMSFIHLHWM